MGISDTLLLKKSSLIRVIWGPEKNSLTEMPWMLPSILLNSGKKQQG
jgi:hypothetical protein